MTTWQTRFADLVHRYIPGFISHNGRGVALCIFHSEKTPSLTIDLEKCVFYCFGCAQGGGVKKFTELVGEKWKSTRSESRTAKARRARFQAEQQARAILARRTEERHKALCIEHRETHAKVISLADLLALFHRHPDLAVEFPKLLNRTEKEYGQAIYKLSLIAAKLDGEVEA